MSNRDKRVDAYIKNAEPFAQPILKHLRELVHTANPEIQETIKWGMPAFEHKGPCCGMASFKQHVSFGFWKYELMKDPKKYLDDYRSRGGEAMGNLGRIGSLKDLPPDKVLIDFVKQATKLNDEGIKSPSKERKPTKPLAVPAELLRALKSSKKAKKVFDEFSVSAKNEYISWITEAKTEKTRLQRLETAIEWIGEGKHRNWKYQKK